MSSFPRSLAASALSAVLVGCGGSGETIKFPGGQTLPKAKQVEREVETPKQVETPEVETEVETSEVETSEPVETEVETEVETSEPVETEVETSEVETSEPVETEVETPEPVETPKQVETEVETPEPVETSEQVETSEVEEAQAANVEEKEGAQGSQWPEEEEAQAANVEEERSKYLAKATYFAFHSDPMNRALNSRRAHYSGTNDSKVTVSSGDLVDHLVPGLTEQPDILTTISNWTGKKYKRDNSNGRTYEAYIYSYTLDPGHASYGWWIEKDKFGDPLFVNIFVDSKGNPNPTILTDNTLGTATYVGGAVGKFSMTKTTESQFYHSGEFIATATLNADFTNNIISGTIDDFAITEGRKFSASLIKVELGETSIAKNTQLATLGNNSTLIIDGENFAKGNWFVKFQDIDTADSLPKVVYGGFDGKFEDPVSKRNVRLVGAFGANKGQSAQFLPSPITPSPPTGNEQVEIDKNLARKTYSAFHPAPMHRATYHKKARYSGTNDNEITIYTLSKSNEDIPSYTIEGLAEQTDTVASLSGWAGKKYKKDDSNGKTYEAYVYSYSLDSGYASYGWWMEKDKFLDPLFLNIFVDSKGNPNPTTFTSNTIGTATYTGSATGQFSMMETQNNEYDSGEFTATATLNADFTTNKISGTINNFSGPSDGQSWSVDLGETSITKNTQFATLGMRNSNWIINSQSSTENGNWFVKFQDIDTADSLPKVVYGGFHAKYKDSGGIKEGRMVGAFGANKQ